MTLSTPVKIVALAALAIALGLGGLLVLTHGSSPSAAVTPVAVHVPHVTVKVAPKPQLHLDPGLPSVVRSALEKRAVAVVAIYSSQSATDRSLLAAARAGAHEAHAAFVAANVALEGVALGVSTWAGPADVPAVVVVRRPGRIVFAAGLTDSATVAQAATTSR